MYEGRGIHSHGPKELLLASSLGLRTFLHSIRLTPLSVYAVRYLLCIRGATEESMQSGRRHVQVRLLVLTRAQLLIDQMLPELHEKLSTPRSLLTLSTKLARDVLTQISVSRTTKTRSTRTEVPVSCPHFVVIMKQHEALRSLRVRIEDGQVFCRHDKCLCQSFNYGPDRCPPSAMAA